MLLDILKLNQKSEAVKSFLENIRQGVPMAVFGIESAYKNFLVSSVDKPVLYVVKDRLTAENACTMIKQFSDKKVFVLPAKDEVLLSAIAFSKDNVNARISVLSKIREADVVIVTAEGIIQSFPLGIKAVMLKKGEEYSFKEFIKSLVSIGYVREETAEVKGSFSVRGDIIDVYPIDMENPIRLDFFGDTLESIKIIDAESRKVLEKRDDTVILQAVETVFTDSDFEVIKKQMQKEVDGAVGERKLKLRILQQDTLTAMEHQNHGVLSTFSHLVGKACNIGGLLRSDTVIMIDEGKMVYETSKLAETEFIERYRSLAESGDVFACVSDSITPIDSVKEIFFNFQQVSLQSLSGDNRFFSPIKIINPDVSGVAEYRFAKDEAFNDIRTWLKSGYSIVVTAGNKKNADVFGCDLHEKSIPYTMRTDRQERGLLLLETELDKGFVSHDGKTVIIGSGNLFPKSTADKKIKVKSGAFFTAPEAGDYCVHETHGIGRVIGNRKISSTESTKEYVAVEYAGKDILYVPVEQLDILTRYLGAEKTPKLSKLGGADFARVKKGVIDSIKKMSFDLKELYKKRNAVKGFAFQEDEEMQALFDGAFKYEDTPDQSRTALEIRKDMNSERVMDRLVCGDVGFGKTEMAFRAVFRAILNGKQVAMLAPTTILTEQHFNTAKDRFKDFPIRIECLNRFRTKAQQDQIVEDLKDGKIDLVIGTHRLLSKDIGFKNLGLLVLDEEQRFGVEHKEKIKLLKNNVDTLTLTATPIPRTLHMSLSGIREISTINTPPKKRLPVQVYVTEETETLIRDAVMREVNRGGQVFILYNRVETIFQFAKRIEEILPNIKSTVVHGQMDERTIEKNIIDFYSGGSQLLITTTIIENGIDLPKANTIIVIDADKLGLSTLYQLKGRVGRSDRLAYAYFTYKRDKVLTSDAYNRLSAIIEFTEMGSGIKIAMRDLEIRGAGNVLGAEQHGHMDKIGYELYSKLLKEELTGERERTVELDVMVDAFIPDKYIVRSSSRMETYKRIAEIRTLKDAREIREDLIETYGEIPMETQMLIVIALVKRYASEIGVDEIVVNKNFVAMVFEDIKAFSNESLQKAMDYSGVDTRIIVSGKPTLEFIRERESNDKMLMKMLEFLIFLRKTEKAK